MYRAIVCDSSSSTEVNGNATEARSDDYTFYALVNGATTKSEVKLVMPLGGMQNGLYRFPKIGEEVLVDTVTGGESGKYYFFGYLPTALKQPFTGTTQNADTTNTDVIKKHGQVLRYGRNGDSGTGPYSEIGFYQETSGWPSKSVTPGSKNNDKSLSYDYDMAVAASKAYHAGGTDDNANAAMTKVNATASEEDKRYVRTNFPTIDRLKVTSTGDIWESAENQHRIRARRFEVAVGESANANGDAIPKEGVEPSSLDAGSIVVNADGGITISSLSSITLKVGRTSIVISDSGCSITSKTIAGAMYSSWDTSFSVAARSGISGSGRSIGLAAGYKFSLSDGYTGGISSTGGVVSVSGYSVKNSATGIESMVYHNIMDTFDETMSIVTGSLALADSIKNNDAERSKKLGEGIYLTKQIYSMLKVLAGFGSTLASYYGWFGYFNVKADLMEQLDVLAKAKKASEDRLVQQKDLELLVEENANLGTPKQEVIDLLAEVTAKNEFDAKFEKENNALNLGSISAAKGNIATLGMLEGTELVAAIVNMILSLTATVYSFIDTYKIGTMSGQEKINAKNILNFVAISTDDAIIKTAFVGFLAGVPGLSTAKVALRPNGDLIMKAGASKHLYSMEATTAAVTAPMMSEKAAEISNNVSAAMQLIDLVGPITDSVKYKENAPAVYPTLGAK
jgi:hypothetical protein